MPTTAPHQQPPSKPVVGLPGKNVKLSKRDPTASDDGITSPFGPGLVVEPLRPRGRSPLGITLDTSLAQRQPQSPGILTADRRSSKRRSSMLVIPSFDSMRSKVSKRKDAPSALELESGLSPQDRYVPIILSNPNTPEFLRLNSRRHANQQKAEQLSPAASSAPPAIIVTPTDNIPPSSPRRTQTEPAKVPRSSSIYTRNTRLFATPHTGHDAVPPLPKMPGKYRLSSFSPITPMTTTTVFEEDREMTPSLSLSPMSGRQRMTMASIETALPTPLRHNGWWNLLSPMLPQGLTRACTAPARLAGEECDDACTSPLVPNAAPMSADLSRGFDDGSVLQDPAKSIQRTGTQRTIPTTGEAAEYYNPDNDFETDRAFHGPEAPLKTNSADGPTRAAVPAAAVAGVAAGALGATALDHRNGLHQSEDLDSVIMTPSQEEEVTSFDQGRNTPVTDPAHTSVPEARSLGSAFQTPRPVVSATDQSKVPDTPVELTSPGVVADAAVGRFHTANSIQTRQIERSPSVMPAEPIDDNFEDATRNFHGQPTPAMHYRGFSGTYASPRPLSSDHEESHRQVLENVYADDRGFTHLDGSSPYPYRAPSPPRTPSLNSLRHERALSLNSIRHERTPAFHKQNAISKESVDFPGREKAIAMGMDEYAEYRIYNSRGETDYANEKAAGPVSSHENGIVKTKARRRWFTVEEKDAGHMSKRGKITAASVVIAMFLVLLLSTVLAMTLARSSGDDMPVGAQWLNLTSFPPIPTGISTMARSSIDSQAACVQNTDLWSCSMPKEQQPLIDTDKPDIPNFRFEIRYVGDEKGLANSTTSPISNRSKRDVLQDLVATPWPPPPSINDRAFLGNTTDETQPFEGETTPFAISILALTQVNTTDAQNSTTSSTPQKRGDNNDSDQHIPHAPLALNQTASPATLYPELKAQPLHLFNRGQASEHYGFYTYFTRSLFLTLPGGAASLNSTATAQIPANAQNALGGAPRAQANAYCTWPQTRLHVRLFTRADTTIATSTTNSSGTTNANETSNESATSFAARGTARLPLSVRLDRHGGDAAAKGVVCYDVDAGGRVDQGSAVVVAEERGVLGRLVNPAGRAFVGVEGVGRAGGWGGVDGGRGGCGCEWTNYA